MSKRNREPERRLKPLTEWDERTDSRIYYSQHLSTICRVNEVGIVEFCLNLIPAGSSSGQLSICSHSSTSDQYSALNPSPRINYNNSSPIVGLRNSSEIPSQLFDRSSRIRFFFRSLSTLSNRMSSDPFVVSDHGRTISPALHSHALNRQQQQYDEYVRQHQQRNNRRQGQPSTSTSSSSAQRSNQSTILSSLSSSSSSSSQSPSYDHFDDLTGISEYHLAHDDGPMNASSVQMMGVEPNHRYHPGLPSGHSHSASDSPSSDSILSSRLSTWQCWFLFSQRSSSCIRQRVDWGERSTRSKIALIATLIICQAIALIIMISGIVHLKDNFGVSHSSTKSGDKNMCQELPIFLIVTGVIFTVATLTATLLVLLAVSIERASPAANNEERYTKRIQRMDWLEWHQISYTPSG